MLSEKNHAIWGSLIADASLHQIHERNQKTKYIDSESIMMGGIINRESCELNHFILR